ncbi:MAG: hypothetical protein HYT41_00415 [Candidatus Sungbacteria bacterium]|nr:hypothetical protein [Candidatus Sungbacteria bacterium]
MPITVTAIGRVPHFSHRRDTAAQAKHPVCPWVCRQFSAEISRLASWQYTRSSGSHGRESGVRTISG